MNITRFQMKAYGWWAVWLAITISLFFRFMEGYDTTSLLITILSLLSVLFLFSAGVVFSSRPRLAFFNFTVALAGIVALFLVAR